MDPVTYVQEIAYQMREEYDRFIFESIKPYCEEVAKMEISKEDLNEALAIWKNHDHELEKLKEELHATAEMHDDGCYYLRDEWIDEYFEKYMRKKEVTNDGSGN